MVQSSSHTSELQEHCRGQSSSEQLTWPGLHGGAGGGRKGAIREPAAAGGACEHAEAAKRFAVFGVTGLCSLQYYFCRTRATGGYPGRSEAAWRTVLGLCCVCAVGRGL